MVRFGMRLSEGTGKVIRVYPSFHGKNVKIHDAPLSCVTVLVPDLGHAKFEIYTIVSLVTQVRGH